MNLQALLFVIVLHLRQKTLFIMSIEKKRLFLYNEIVKIYFLSMPKYFPKNVTKRCRFPCI